MESPSLKIYDEHFKELVKPGVQFVQGEISDAKKVVIDEERWESNPSTLKCSYCRVEFTTPEVQREHYKLDWHRYNLKLGLESKQPVTEEEFNDNADEISSISASSDSEKEDAAETLPLAQSKIFLKTNEGIIFSIYRGLLFDKKEEADNARLLLARLKSCYVNNQWTVLMLGGGHFAGGVFRGGTPIVHKTFHCYTVRAGQGGAQGSRDNKSGGTQPKSAGASLRRYNENALAQHVGEIMESWKTEIKQSSIVMYRAAGPYNRAVLFGGKTPAFERSDPRLRRIPFTTKRATFKELLRVYDVLTTIRIYDRIPEQKHSQLPDAKRVKIKNTNINRAKSREDVQRPLPIVLSSAPSTEDESAEIELSSSFQEISFTEDQLDNFKTPINIETKTKVKKKKTKIDKKLEANVAEETIKALDDLICNKSVEEFQSFLAESEIELQSIRIDNTGNTLLHVASVKKKIDFIEFLLQNGADPSVTNNKQEVAYIKTEDKEVKDVFVLFARKFPDKYNYKKALINLDTLTSKELAEKKKAKRKVKKEKKELPNEELEQQKFIALPDSEKKSLVAEKKLRNENNEVITRCFLCGCVTEKTPFEYSQNLFCSVGCLRTHRFKMK